MCTMKEKSFASVAVLVILSRLALLYHEFGVSNMASNQRQR